MTPRPLVRALLPLTLAAVVLSGCARQASTSSGDTPAGSGSAAASASLDAVTVTGDAGAKPTLTFDKPFAVDRTRSKAVTEGDGAELKAGDRVTMEYLGVNATDGKEFDTSWGQKTATFVLDEKEVIKGMATGLVGAKVGSRVLLAIPPADAYQTQGVPAVGIGPTDTLLFVVDIKSTAPVLQRATGTAVVPRQGLPTVKLGDNGAPTITLPATAPPSALVVQPLIQGKGAKVTKGQTIRVHYTGVVWPGGKVFDSSWEKNAPASFPIGVGQVIRGWDTGLVGQTIGSQVLLVIPPDQGYGAAGQPPAIKGTDTLVFVVDILDAS